ncbi:MAG: dethiobiotin synthase [Myxococcales bacterium]|nr:dethiobiotin synthase [Myxococcales bacterium]
MKYFVTGTDTGVGKTHVTAALVTGLRAAGRRARAVKPIETGWDAETSDAARLALASDVPIELTIWRALQAPRSPKAAAALEGRPIDAPALVHWCATQAGDPLFIEGAGGWMVPISEAVSMRDVAVEAADAVIVVGRAGLGTVNHSLLTIAAVQQRMAMMGLILSRHPDESLEFARENADEIAVQTGARVGIFPDDLGAIFDWFTGAFDDHPTHRISLR